MGLFARVSGLFYFAFAALSVPAAVLYVDAGSASPSAPYDSWATAAVTVQEALDVASDGDTVLVTNGTYATGGALAESILNRVVITNAVSIRSVNGPAVTVIDGGGSNRVVYLEHAGASLEGFTLTRGWTQYSIHPGAGLRGFGGTVSNCWIRSNIASNSLAGGVHAENHMQFFDCRIESNAARSAYTSSDRGNGGGLFLAENSSNELIRCIIRDNHASRFGGGIHFRGMLVLRESEVMDNLAESDGGGTYQYYTSPGFQIRNTLIAGNESLAIGGGIRAGDGLLESCTIVGNSAGSRAGGASCHDTSLRNTILYGNEAPTFPDWERYNQWDDTTATNCILGTTNGMPGINLQDADPLLVDAAAGDYRPAFGSPAIGAGVQDAWMTGADDLAGHARILDGQVDIGAYEYVPAALAVAFSATTARVEFNPITVTFQATVGGSNTAGVGVSWDFDDDGSPDAVGALAQVTNTYTTAGLYDVRLTVTNAAGDTAESIRRRYIKSAADILYASPTGSHTAPFTSPATAATNLASAIELGWNGSTVMVAAGTYELDSGLSLEDGITLQGPVDGAPAILDAGGQFRALNVNHDDARIRHLTITGGYVEDEDGAGILLQAGAVEHCRLVANQTDPVGSTDKGGAIYMMTNTLAAHCLIESNNAGQGGGIYMYRGGMVSNCVIRDNQARNSGSAGGGIYMYYGGKVFDTSVLANEGNSATSERGAGVYITGLGRLVNSVIVSNIGTGVYNEYTSDPETLIQNCTIAYNTQYGLYNSGGGDGTLRNSILYHNDSNNGNGYNLDQLVVTHCCTTPSEGSSPVTAAPDFGPGLHLLSTSPCTDAGTATGAPAHDRDGLVRPLDGDGNGSALVDIGAFERADRHLEAAGNAQAISTGDSTPSSADGTDFGGVAVGDAVQQIFTITNTGNHVASLTGDPRVTITGPDAADFAVVSQPAATLAGTNGATAFTLSFSPSAGGTRQAAIRFASDDWDRTPYTFDVQGEGENAPRIRLTGNGSTLTNGAAPPVASNGTAFGIVRAGSGVLTNTFTIRNDGAADLVLSNTTVTPGTGFVIARGPGSPVSGGAATTVTVTFASATVGVHQATVSIEHNDSGETTPFSFAVEARAGGDVELRVLGNDLWIQNGDDSPDPADNTDAGNTDLGTFTDLAFVLTNAGPDELNLLGDSPVLLHQDGTDFSIQTAPATPIDGHRTSSLTLRFMPSAPGVSTALVEILSDDAARSSYTFAVSGTGVGEPDLSVLGRGRAIPAGDDSPTVRDNTWFGAATNGGGTVTRAFSLTNGGNEPLVISDVRVGGSGDLSVPSFPGTVEPGSASNLLVDFTATSDGMTEGTLTIDSDDPSTPSYSFKIAGLGVSGPAPMTFYVRPDNPAAQAPYTNWAMAATGIAQAVDLAVGQAGIAVSNGHYDVSETVLLTEPVHLYGVGAPATLDGQQACTILEIQHPDTRVSALTLRGGAPCGIAMLSGGTVSNCTFTGFGSASQTGSGGIQIMGFDPPVQDTDSAVHMPGGGLVTHALFTSNALDNAVSILDGGTVHDSSFIDNVTQNGAVYIENTGLVRRCTFRRNDALFSHDRTGGGAATLDNGGALVDSLIVDNTGFGGGGVHLNHGGIVENCLIISNRAGYYTDAQRTNFTAGGRGGGLYIETGGDVRHCTLAANDAAATGTGGGLYRHSNGGTVLNSIIYGNSAGSGSNWYHNNGAGSSTCTLTAPAFTGAGNIAGPAGFRDPAGDFHLAWDSPAVDAGTNTAVDADLNGTTRPVDGDQDGTATVDMGAYEFEPAILLSTNMLTVAENGTAALSIQLAEQPDASVTVTVGRASGDTDLSVSGGATRIFSTGNWETPQSTTIAAAGDPDQLDGSAVFYCRLDGVTRAAFTAVELDENAQVGGEELYRVRIDFNDVYVPAGNWNTADSPYASGQVLTNMIGTNGAATAADLYIADSFSGANGSGIADSSLYPAEAQRDSFYITGSGSVGSQTQAIVQVRGLSSSNVYDITLFGSRSAADDDRTSRFVINGETQYVHCADNTTNAAVFTGLTAPTGAITVALTPYNETNALQEYAYIGVLDLTAYAAESGPEDQDGDGMPDWWETLHGGGATSLMPHADDDGDGMSNLPEYIADTVPTNAASQFRISDMQPSAAGDRYVLHWASASGRVYAVYWRTNLLSTSGFDAMQSNLPATPPVNIWTDSVHGTQSKGFYRIRVQMETP